MKKIGVGVVSCVLCFFLSGCVVQSLHPFYTEKTKIQLDSIQGEWQLIKEFGNEVKPDERQHWTIVDNVLTTYDEKGISGKLIITPFKLNGEVFLDLCADDPGDTISFYWSCHVFPVHTVCKFEQESDIIRAVPLDSEWFEDMVKQRKIKTTTTEQDYSIFTVNSRKLQKFLRKHKDNLNAFSKDNEIVLRKLK